MVRLVTRLGARLGARLVARDLGALSAPLLLSECACGSSLGGRLFDCERVRTRSRLVRFILVDSSKILKIYRGC